MRIHCWFLEKKVPLRKIFRFEKNIPLRNIPDSAAEFRILGIPVNFIIEKKDQCGLLKSAGHTTSGGKKVKTFNFVKKF